MGQQLFQEANTLKALLRTSLGWEFDMQELASGHGEDDDDEDGPVVVENPEDFVAL